MKFSHDIDKKESQSENGLDFRKCRKKGRNTINKWEKMPYKCRKMTTNDQKKATADLVTIVQKRAKNTCKGIYATKIGRKECLKHFENHSSST